MIHELGHFFAAKWAGVTVNEFWLGMGPNLYKKHYKGTDYCLKAFPFGGAVVMEGEDADSLEEGSYGSVARYKKAIILASGPLMNFVLGFIIVFAIFINVDRVATTQITGFADGFKYESEEQLMIGDEILSIDGYKIWLYEDVTTGLSLSRNGGIYDIIIKRDGQKIEINDFSFQPDTFIIDGEEVYRYGLEFGVEDLSFMGQIENVALRCFNYIRMVWQSVVMLFSGNVEVEELSGPVGISVMIGEAASISMMAMWNFVAFISINLGVMNLLPLPALDGGRLFVLIIEAITRKKVPPKIEAIIHGAGLAILLALMVFITFNDIFVRIFK